MLGHLLLAPPVGHRAQQRDEGGGGRWNDVLLRAKLDELRVPLQGRREKSLSRQKHDDEFRGGCKLRGVALLGQGSHVPTDVGRVLVQFQLPHRLVLYLVGVEVRLERGLAVHHHLLAPGELDHHVGPEPSSLPRHLRLLHEVTVGEHARVHHPLQLNLPQRSAHRGGTQRPLQPLRLLLS